MRRPITLDPHPGDLAYEGAWRMHWNADHNDIDYIEMWDGGNKIWVYRHDKRREVFVLVAVNTFRGFIERQS